MSANHETPSSNLKQLPLCVALGAVFVTDGDEETGTFPGVIVAV
jgi:hypothetical protein